MTNENREAAIEHLNEAMGHLYQARYRVTGPEGAPNSGKTYPEMDREAFDAIATLQSSLSTVIAKLGKK